MFSIGDEVKIIYVGFGNGVIAEVLRKEYKQRYGRRVPELVYLVKSKVWKGWNETQTYWYRERDLELHREAADYHLMNWLENYESRNLSKE